MVAAEAKPNVTPAPPARLAKVYVEPTSRCNLACRTCMRGAWGEPLGDMDAATFDRLLASLSALDPVPDVFFGGIGEPLFHPDSVRMVARAKALGTSVELITNGTLLTAHRSRALMEAGLDVLWVSLDGATPASYEDVRQGAALNRVLDNLKRFAGLRGAAGPEIGIAFVAMRRNLDDLPALLHLAREMGASRFLVTNVLPYTHAMCAEVLYARALSNSDDLPVLDLPHFFMPRMDRVALANPALRAALGEEWGVTVNGGGARAQINTCPFVETGVLAVGWDGGISPCLPLLHTHTGYLHGCERLSRRWVMGQLDTHTLDDVWHAPDYRDFRAAVQEFDFSPCSLCDGCLLSETNDADCYGSTFPTCGGCLWAQGIIRCP